MNLNSDQINCPLAPGSMDSTCGLLLPGQFPHSGLGQADGACQLGLHGFCDLFVEAHGKMTFASQPSLYPFLLVVTSQTHSWPILPEDEV